MPVEIMILGWSVVLLAALIIVQAQLATKETGLTYNMSPRDVEAPLGVMAGRASRALKNYLETWPAFIALSLALAVTQRTGGLAETGAWIWLVARLIHPLLYLGGIPVARTLVWAVSLIGLLLMLIRLMGWY